MHSQLFDINISFSFSTAVPDVKRTWRSPDLKTFNSRKAAVDYAKVLVKRDKLIDKVLHGFGGHGLMCRPVKPTKKAALDAGLARFLRDGLWVVGQEEDWLEEALEVWKMREANREKREEKEAREAAVEAEAQEKAEGEKKEAVKMEVVSAPSSSGMQGSAVLECEYTGSVTSPNKNKPSSPSIEKPKADAQSAKAPPAAEQAEGTANASAEGTGTNVDNNAIIEGEYTRSMTSPNKNLPSSPVAKKQKTDAPSSEAPPAGGDASTSAESTGTTVDNSARMITPSPTSNGDAAAASSGAGAVTTAAAAVAAVASSAAAAVAAVASSAAAAVAGVASSQSTISTSSEDQGNKVVDAHVADVTTSTESADTKKVESAQKKKKPQGPRKPPKIAQSTHYRLTQAQIDACNVAVKEHYDKVMYTVKARNLFFELADGFDVLRERGRGRFDMELDAFDTPAFDFLTDLNKAAWMPIVRKILGDDAILVHKGAFLSTPGAETQIYHQDGVHLNKKIQKPCHAVNVFIPLVDLDISNGPTEFCLGTHYLGYEHFARDMCDTPTPQAGTPLIFDYRLGHRGLGNSSPHSRPVVYLTYTPASSEFKDSVNFSRKRYKKLGELVDKPLSRSERALKRKREIEESKKPPAEVSEPTATCTSSTDISQATCAATTTAMTAPTASAAATAPAPTTAIAASTIPATAPSIAATTTAATTITPMDRNASILAPAVPIVAGVPAGMATTVPPTGMATASMASVYNGVPSSNMAAMIGTVGMAPAMAPNVAGAHASFPRIYNHTVSSVPFQAPPPGTYPSYSVGYTPTISAPALASVSASAPSHQNGSGRSAGGDQAEQPSGSI